MSSQFATIHASDARGRGGRGVPIGLGVVQVAGGAGAVTIDPTSTARSETSPMTAALERLRPLLFRSLFVRTGRNQHLAEDLLQQTFLAAQTSAASVPIDELERWCRGVSRNLLVSHWRRIGSRPAHVPMVDQGLAGELADRLGNETLPASVMARREVQDHLLLALTELDADEHDLVVGHYFRGESFAALAQRLSTSERAVEGRLYRARKALRERLKSLD